jgi:membrane-associated phospholipid phosphatase
VTEQSGGNDRGFLKQNTTWLLFSLVVLAASAIVARKREIDPLEGDVFRLVNRLPRKPSLIIQIIMQAGALGASFVAAAIAFLAGKRPLARDLALGGAGAWFVAKFVKTHVGRGRPTAVFDDVQVHGAHATGLGFPSGHAAVSAAMATAAGHYLPKPARGVAWAIAGTVAFARVYVGAHLPVDIVGGIPLGIAVASALAILWRVLGISNSHPNEPRTDHHRTP